MPEDRELWRAAETRAPIGTRLRGRRGRRGSSGRRGRGTTGTNRGDQSGRIDAGSGVRTSLGIASGMGRGRCSRGRVLAAAKGSAGQVLEWMQYTKASHGSKSK